MNVLKMSEKCTLGHIFQGTMNYLCDTAKVALLYRYYYPPSNISQFLPKLGT